MLLSAAAQPQQIRSLLPIPMQQGQVQTSTDGRLAITSLVDAAALPAS
jgi:hypothetical protein